MDLSIVLPLQLENYHYGMLFFGFVFVSIFMWLWYKARDSHSWASGNFPAYLKANEANLIESYTALGALMLSVDRETPGHKVDYMLQYFSQNFRTRKHHLRENIIFAIRNQVTPKSVTDWVNKRYQNPKQKSQIIHFLVDVGMVDGSLTKNERTFIKMVNGYLKLSPSLVDQIITEIDQKSERRRKSSQQKTVHRPLNKAYSILGLQGGASADEIKKAYRNLVKIHHPDNFVNASENEQDKAEERFIEIQQAYESLS